MTISITSMSSYVLRGELAKLFMTAVPSTGLAPSAAAAEPVDEDKGERKARMC